jgi:dihydrofolate reductase
LADRENIVITQNPRYSAEGYIVAHSVDEAIRKASNKKVFIIGGAQIFNQAQQSASKAYLTLINYDFDGDTKYHFDDSKWKLESRVDFDDDQKNCPSYSFLEYSRI